MCKHAPQSPIRLCTKRTALNGHLLSMVSAMCTVLYCVVLYCPLCQEDSHCDACVCRHGPHVPFSFLWCADGTPKEVRFYKSWDKYGGLSNFSAHPIQMPYVSCPLPSAAATSAVGGLAAGSSAGRAPAVAATPFMPGSHAPHAPEEEVEWGSVEHFYQVRHNPVVLYCISTTVHY